MGFLPAVTRATYEDGYRIRLVFNDTSVNTVNFSRWIVDSGPVFEPLKDIEYFKRFFVDGGTVCWPNGADIAPETLYHVYGRVAGTRPIVRVASVAPRSGLSVHLTFTDGSAGEVDLAPFISGRELERVRADRALFESVRVDPYLGTIAWDNGVDLDPDQLYEALKG